MEELADFGVLAAVYFLVCFKRWRAEGKDVLLVNTLMYVYLVFVLYFALMPVITSLPTAFNHSYQPMNLTPFVDVVNERGNYMEQIGLNIVMMIPFGFLLPLMKPGEMNLMKVMLYTFLLSLAIELLQPFFLRSSDITDIITNVVGGLVGYVAYLALRPLLEKILGRLKIAKT